MERSKYRELKPRSLPFHRWYASAETQEKGIEFLLNPEAMEEFSREVRNAASWRRLRFGKNKINRYGADCDLVSKIAKRKLRRMGLRARYVKEQFILRSGLRSSLPGFFHAFVMVCDKERKRDIIYDAQYLQFLMKVSKHFYADSSDLPDVMVGSISNREEMYALLKKHKADGDSWQFYGNGIFSNWHDVSHEPSAFRKWWRSFRGKE